MDRIMICAAYSWCDHKIHNIWAEEVLRDCGHWRPHIESESCEDTCDKCRESCVVCNTVRKIESCGKCQYRFQCWTHRFEEGFE